MAAGAKVASQRITWIVVTYCLIACILIFRVGYIATVHSDEREALRNQSISDLTCNYPGVRGRILSSDGTVLAYSQRCLKLLWQVPADAVLACETYDILSRSPYATHLALPADDTLADLLGHEICLAEDADFNEPALLALLEDNHLSLRVVFFFKRFLTSPDTAEIIGKTAIDPNTGIEYGISGIELQFDNRLKGKVLTVKLFSNAYKALPTDAQSNGEDIIVQRPGGAQ